MHKRPNKVWLSTKLFCITSGILSKQKNWFGKSIYLESFLMEQPPYKLKWNHIADITKIKQKLTRQYNENLATLIDKSGFIAEDSINPIHG